MTNIIECDRCGKHVKTSYVLWYMKKPSYVDLKDITVLEFTQNLEPFHYCQQCQDSIDRDFPAVLKKKTTEMIMKEE